MFTNAQLCLQKKSTRLNGSSCIALYQRKLFLLLPVIPDNKNTERRKELIGGGPHTRPDKGTRGLVTHHPLKSTTGQIGLENSGGKSMKGTRGDFSLLNLSFLTLSESTALAAPLPLQARSARSLN